MVAFSKTHKQFRENFKKVYPPWTTEECTCQSGYANPTCYWTDKPYEPKVEYVKNVDKCYEQEEEVVELEY